MVADGEVAPESLVRYLSDLAQLRTRTLLDLASYQSVLWLSDVPVHPNCRSRLNPDELSDRSEWLVVDRVDLPLRPVLPADLQPWLDGVELDRADVEPTPVASLTTTEEFVTADGTEVRSVETRLNDAPELVVAWDRYLADWLAWAARRAVLDPVHAVYTQLFQTAEHVRQVGEQVEIIVAVGLLTVNGERGAVRRHLLTAPAQITLNPQSGRISVEPATDVPTTVRLEQDMLTPGETPGTEVQGLIRADLATISDPLDLQRTGGVLEMWANGASSEAKFERELGPTSVVSSTPHVRLAPAVIVRPRSQAAILDTYTEILASIAADEAVPPTFADLVATGSGGLTDEERANSGLDLAGEHWFPLPANQEQGQIVEQLRTRRGVIVHGPPGTGKSHTIANLISHAMAMGQRVLVTSHSARALEVLADKLPEDIRSLTVTMLGQGRRGTDDLERSANEILRRRQDPEWKRVEISDRLTRLLDQLEALRARRAATLKHLGEVRERETDTIDLGFGGYVGTRASLALDLATAAPPPTWLTVLPVGPSPLLQGEVEELTKLRTQLSDALLQRGRMILPDLSVLPQVDDIRAGVAEYHSTADRLDRVDPVPPETAAAIAAIGPHILDELGSRFAAYETVVQAVQRRNVPWLTQVVNELGSGREARWRALHKYSVTFIDRSEQLARYDAVHVAIAPGLNRLELRAQALALQAFFDEGGTIRRVAALNPKVVRDAEHLIEGVRVAGAIPDDSETCRRFISWCDAHAGFDEVEQQWPPGVLIPGSTLLARRASIIDATGGLADALAVHDRGLELVAFTDQHGLNMQVIPTSVAGLLLAREAVGAEQGFAAAKANLVRRHGEVQALAGRPGSNPVSALLGAAIADLQPDTYEAVLRSLTDERELAERVRRLDNLVQRLHAALPSAAALASDPATVSLLTNLEVDWNRARARAWLADLGRDDANQASLEVARTDDLIRDVISEIGANKAWLAAIGRLTDADTQHLKAYQTAMKRVGKGGSKFDLKYRQEARLHLSHCQGAIPAWIMPAHQVAATMPRTPGLFDLVVIDEASQSGVEELFLFWLGKQIVVVGDKQQIAPDGSFVKGEAQDLQRRHLDGWSFAGDFGPENSLFDIAGVKYVSGEVWLSEHFRSMPEIIEYSNKLCYADHRLQPVRQYGRDRLDPLKRTHIPWIPDGTGGASKLNRDEAEAIVKQVVDCIADPAYRAKDGRPLSMGVISLLGPDQANLIQRRLLEVLDTKAITERRIHVGDAADFQGDERDVIFLSMVKTPSATGARLPKLGHDRDSRRFNVAASRARDQLWLFHSVSLDDLNPECPRARLISHMDNPGLEALEGFDGILDRDNLQAPFESLFEQRVYLDLAHRGYKMRPQWKVLGYRIDLVVIGADSQLAVEIDGDYWHGPDRYAADLARQGDLERVGWRIARIKEWEYYADRERALAPVFEMLDDLNIGPGGTRLREPVVTTVADDPIQELLEETDGAETDSDFDVPFDDAFLDAETDSPEPSKPAVVLPAQSVPPPLPPAPRVGGVDRYEPAVLTAVAEPTTMTPRELSRQIVEVVAIEGPVIAERVFQLINAAAGNQRLGARIRAAMDAALRLASSEGALLVDNPLGQDPLLATLRLPAQATVLVREIGPRSLQHVPPGEIGATLATAGEHTGLTGVDLYRHVHTAYGFSRMREAAAAHYRLCEALLPPVEDRG